MKFFQYYDEHQTICTGIVKNGKAYRISIPMMELISAQKSKEEMDLLPCEEQLDMDMIRFAPVVTGSEKILCIGLNYYAHQEETNLRNSAAFPPVFPKFQNSLAAHHQPIRLPKNAVQFDYEVELVIVIGKTASGVSVDDAEDYIFGYTVGNDFSARDLQMATSQWMMGKACDDFAPVGPFIVPKDELDTSNLQIDCAVNGKTCQNGNTADMIFNCAQIVSRLSENITLQPGDLIYTGTPSGVILGKPADERVWLKAGDCVEVSVEGIGTLCNTLVNRES